MRGRGRRFAEPHPQVVKGNVAGARDVPGRELGRGTDLDENLAGTQRGVESMPRHILRGAGGQTVGDIARPIDHVLRRTVSRCVCRFPAMRGRPEDCRRQHVDALVDTRPADGRCAEDRIRRGIHEKLEVHLPGARRVGGMTVRMGGDDAGRSSGVGGVTLTPPHQSRWSGRRVPRPRLRAPATPRSPPPQSRPRASSPRPGEDEVVVAFLALAPRAQIPNRHGLAGPVEPPRVQLTR